MVIQTPEIAYVRLGSLAALSEGSWDARCRNPACRLAGRVHDTKLTLDAAPRYLSPSLQVLQCKILFSRFGGPTRRNTDGDSSDAAQRTSASGFIVR